MPQPFAQADGVKLARGTLVRVGNAGKLQWDRDVLQGRHCRDKMKGLKHDSDMAPTKDGQRVLIQRAQFLPRHYHLSAVGPLQTRHHHEQRRFTRPGGADQADRLAATYMKIHGLEDVNATRASSERQVDAGKRNGRV